MDEIRIKPNTSETQSPGDKQKLVPEGTAGRCGDVRSEPPHMEGARGPADGFVVDGAAIARDDVDGMSDLMSQFIQTEQEGIVHFVGSAVAAVELIVPKVPHELAPR